MSQGRRLTFSRKGRRKGGSRRVDAAEAVPHGGGRARGEHRQEALVLIIAVERDALQRVSLNGNYQDARLLPVLTSGAATAVWNGFRRIDAA